MSFSPSYPPMWQILLTWRDWDPQRKGMQPNQGEVAPSYHRWRKQRSIRRVENSCFYECEWTNDPSHVLAFLSHVHSLPCMFRKVCVEWWSSLCDLISLLLTAWGFTWRRGNPQPLWLTGSSWWEGWGSAWSHRIEANPFWFAEDSIYRWHQCLWISCFGSLATFTILAACEKDLERLGGGEGEFLPVWSDSHNTYIYIIIQTYRTNYI